VRKTLGITLLALVAAACSDATPQVIPVSRSVTYPLEIAAPNGPVEIPRQPLRIVSLSPTATEILFAIGAGPQVVAVDDQSNYPAIVPKTKLSGFEPNVEAIAKYAPDLVVFANDVKQLAKSLTTLKIPALLQPAATSLDDTYEQIAQLGNATDHPNEADKLTARMKKDIALIAAEAPTFTPQPRYYHELDSTYFSVTSSTFIGKVYALLHLRNIADAADKQSSGYPQLSPEYIVQTDPDLIFLADTKCCAQSATTVEKRPGWSGITAVKNDAVIALDDDIASRWGPRVVDFLRTVAAALSALEKAA
jgi:cobalamin transport system substrate-binding protein